MSEYPTKKPDKVQLIIHKEKARYLRALGGSSENPSNGTRIDVWHADSHTTGPNLSQR
jgi:hypothetical protein